MRFSPQKFHSFSSRFLVGLAAFGLMAAGPLMRPTRDVRVVYRMQAPSSAQAIPQILSWNLERQKLRIDLPSAGVETLIDLRTNQVQLIRHDLHTIVTVPGKPQPTTGTGLVRSGKANLAGLPCTDWKAPDGASVCLTDDGVLLRASANGAVLSQAVDVQYGALPDAAFVPPSDYRQEPESPTKH